jgi:hypothetical protein
MSSFVQYLVQSVPDAAYVASGQYPPPPPRTLGEWVVHTSVAIGAALALAFGVLVATAHAQVVGPMPTGWHAAGAATGDYAVGTDRSRRAGGQGQGGGTIRSRTTSPSELATLQQSVRADAYRGHRVRLSGFVKAGTVGAAAGVAGTAAGLWMRVDGLAGAESADFMQDRPVAQGTDWARYDVVLDVPRDAVGLSFGVLLNGPGQVWLDDVALQRVGRDVPLTGRVNPLVAVVPSVAALRADADRRQFQKAAYRDALRGPVNLSFTEGTRRP